MPLSEALDTQANIKAQNPNATFGEVSKIVASMWDGLGEEQKQVGAVTPTRVLDPPLYTQILEGDQ
uniref:HMG box domain-containing protein n=1 Tax=Gadus morhua TaxID=8049 RepID=A0A8C5C1C2_GADMO